MPHEQEEALWLAQKMGLPDVEQMGDFVWFAGPDDCQAFTPHTNKAQWADVLLWAAKNGHMPSLGEKAVATSKREPLPIEIAVRHDNTDAGIMAATITAICRAAGVGRE